MAHLQCRLPSIHMDPAVDEVGRAAAAAGLTALQYVMRENQRLRAALAAAQPELTENEREIALLRAARDTAIRQVWQNASGRYHEAPDMMEVVGSSVVGGNNSAWNDAAVYEAVDDAIRRDTSAEGRRQDSTSGNELEDEWGANPTIGVNQGKKEKILGWAGLIKVCEFDVLAFTRRLYDRYHTETGALRRGAPGKTSTRQVLAGGTSQHRDSTPMEFVHLLLTHALGIPHVLISCAARGRDDLDKKMTDMVAQVSHLQGWTGLCVKPIDGNDSSTAAHQALLDCIAANGCIVLSDTRAQVQKAHLLLLSHMLRHAEAAAEQQTHHGNGGNPNGRLVLGYAVTMDMADGMTPAAQGAMQVGGELHSLFNSETPPLVNFSVAPGAPAGSDGAARPQARVLQRPHHRHN
ncbi:hypothetical protein JKP88DRAFT_243352 [Tribonema minus]|uniref:Uncharacterized protein n=1 Tax=Tribonema minus TaxID=303371 RepID=A0A835ZHM3_9STRA|nr:hypothetical protein JKP88DRAFT_243352 [Tribonema minus]